MDKKGEVRKIIAEVLEVEEDEIQDTQLFVQDFGADSLRAVEILSRLEKHFKVVIPQEELTRMVSLKETYEVLLAHSNAQ